MIGQMPIHLRPNLCWAMPFRANTITPYWSIVKNILGTCFNSVIKNIHCLVMFGQTVTDLWLNFTHVVQHCYETHPASFEMIG